MSNAYVNIGCGMSTGKGWRNYDVSLTLRFERIPLLGRVYTKNTTRFPKDVEYGDIVKGLSLPNDSCQLIYASHMFEHLALADFRLGIRHVFAYLRKGGVFRLVVPDLEYYIAEYTANRSKNAAIDFMEKTSLGLKERPTSILALVSSLFGSSRHYWMWDYKSLKNELLSVGFRDIRRARFGDNDDPMLKEVEEKTRWDHCLGVECRKEI